MFSRRVMTDFFFGFRKTTMTKRSYEEKDTTEECKKDRKPHCEGSDHC